MSKPRVHVIYVVVNRLEFRVCLVALTDIGMIEAAYAREGSNGGLY